MVNYTHNCTILQPISIQFGFRHKFDYFIEKLSELFVIQLAFSPFLLLLLFIVISIGTLLELIVFLLYKYNNDSIEHILGSNFYAIHNTVRGVCARELTLHVVIGILLMDWL